jgi:hypothetical protein
MKNSYSVRLWLTEFWRDEMGRRFANNEKKAHVKKVNKFVANGGTYVEHMVRTGISRSVLILWREEFGNEEYLPKQNSPLVAVGNPPQEGPPAHYFVISYHGTTIEVTGKDCLLNLLRNVRATNSLIA